jgi:hypothetical protein
MKQQILVLFFLLLFGASGCVPQEQAAPQPPQLISALSAENLAKANALLPDYTAPWCKTKTEHNLIVDAKFIKEERILTARSDGFTSTANLHIFDVIGQIEGSFPHSQLKFIRILNLRDGVIYKLLILRGEHRFWINLQNETYTITNIGPVPNKSIQATPEGAPD